tara:strand:+ start:58 stop:333 length:276 start_codon:yes stop_codon:yes gene_type:complete
MKKLTLSIAALSIAMMSYGQTQCKGKTKSNVQCKNVTKKENSLCHDHDKNHVIKSNSKTVICKGVTKKNTKCKNRTKNKNGLCHNHGGKKD